MQRIVQQLLCEDKTSLFLLDFIHYYFNLAMCVHFFFLSDGKKFKNFI